MPWILGIGILHNPIGRRQGQTNRAASNLSLFSVSRAFSPDLMPAAHSRRVVEIDPDDYNSSAAEDNSDLIHLPSSSRCRR